MILVTGGAGFIGSNFVLDWIAATGEAVVNLDLLTYAGNLRNLASLRGYARHVFVQGDICDRNLVDRLLAENQSTYIPLGQTHRLANPGKVPLEIIEVQSGSYLGEDDIVRFEDTYGRSR